ncbi:hypothetical protein M422DRAFT_255217 [Sphaerobolus stellatus SS14]|uniref:Uncharacterized protein n=1 Tax=Sphaerobolus stellatus (strain SS14) TaxID=990650 RepID=A0A0C9VJ49_SPHS4|nr:hypothetical protein M422DRAFT_255217 [Sphaerobolus stellatus SS14]
MQLDLQQIEAIQRAKQILEGAGLLNSSISSHPPLLLSQIQSIVQSTLPPAPHSSILQTKYIRPAAQTFTPHTKSYELHRLTRQRFIDAIVDHPLNAIVECPESGAYNDMAVAHRFRMDITDPYYAHPKDNIQYSLGNEHEHGCLFDAEEFPNEDVDFEEEINDEYSYEVLRDLRAKMPETTRCKGKLGLRRDGDFRPFIQCEKRRPGHHAHLLIRNLDQYNSEYLQALFYSDRERLLAFETAASLAGYGPLAPCDFIANRKEQKTLCPTWHRDPQGVLCRFPLYDSGGCDTEFEFFTPSDLTQYQIVMVCRNPHTHASPTPSRTPRAIESVFQGLLRELDWRLADTTPRKLVLDAALDKSSGSILADPHHSLGNLDHAARMINKMRSELFPNGTGLQGAYRLLEEHKLLAFEDRYVRAVEEHALAGGGTFKLVVCMFPAISRSLLETRRPSIDTAFKRLHLWQKFEIEGWFDEYNRSVVVARAFITSQSAEAHKILFTRIFSIMEQDTGQPARFRCIHGTGYEIFMADGHKGQALGLGMFCQELCRNTGWYCRIEPSRRLSTLTPYEHLARFYRYCFAHFTRNVTNIQNYITSEVLHAMMSLASAEPLIDLDNTLNIIRNGGPKAVGKFFILNCSPFAFAALYQPASQIPLEIWRASPSTSNGNEQFDSRALIALLILLEHGIHTRDQAATHYRRISRAIIRSAGVQQRTVAQQDTVIQSLSEKILKQQAAVERQQTGLKRTLEVSGNAQQVFKRLQTEEKHLQGMQQELHLVSRTGSGKAHQPT